MSPAGFEAELRHVKYDRWLTPFEPVVMAGDGSVGGHGTVVSDDGPGCEDAEPVQHASGSGWGGHGTGMSQARQSQGPHRGSALLSAVRSCGTHLTAWVSGRHDGRHDGRRGNRRRRWPRPPRQPAPSHRGGIPRGARVRTNRALPPRPSVPPLPCPPSARPSVPPPYRPRPPTPSVPAGSPHTSGARHCSARRTRPPQSGDRGPVATASSDPHPAPWY